MTSTVDAISRNGRRGPCRARSETATSRRQRRDDIEDLLALLFGHARGGLVEQQHFRLGRRSRWRFRAGAACRRAAMPTRACMTSASVKRCRMIDGRADDASVGADRPPPKRRRAPSRSEIASTIVSSGVRSAKSWLIWNVRAMPGRTRRCAGQPVMSRRRERCRRRSACSTPESRLTKVVLPAPFGPISAWRAPAGRAKVTLFVAVEAAEALVAAPWFEDRSHVTSRARRTGAIEAVPQRGQKGQ